MELYRRLNLHFFFFQLKYQVSVEFQFLNPTLKSTKMTPSKNIIFLFVF